MPRGSKKEANTADPEADERTRLKGLAFSRNVLSQKPSRLAFSAALPPSKTLIKHHGTDVLRKSHRKNRYLFSFPGLLGPISGGKIGDLKNLGSKNPLLYLDFPQGQMKLFGTIVYPKNKYLTLQFSKSGKNVTCDDYFDNMIVFSDAWWIGTKEDNPEELQLQFPKELNMEKNEGYDFKGGVGSRCDGKQGFGRLAKKCMEQVSRGVSSEDNSIDNSSSCKENVELTPTRRSARTSGKTFKHARAGSSQPLTLEDDNKVNDGRDLCLEQCDLAGKAEGPRNSTDKPLVQTTLSSLFKKVEDKANKELKQEKNTSEVEDDEDNDDIEEFSNTSEDMDASDEDWAAA
ncbi:DNA-binding protein RHL1 isoform X2 [Andrographis paniculata]|uniref:DNA-binding protein RHL1 isoform X2 n=1 Tax=Andrographis paniculata TaxID=175694 RepID=UPI0021E883EE|nr:DNA-binding protein RHL1 isoform X2 [Andrographis paniculata]